MTKPKVLVTGASGLIGGLVLGNLADRYEFSGLSRHAVPGIPYTVGSITDRDAVRRAVAGQDMVLHLAGETQSLEWDEQFEVTAGGTINVLRAAAAAGVRRFVLMSTGSTMCGWEWDESLPYGRLAAGDRDVPGWDLLDYRTPPRPDSPYGAAKLFCEAAATLVLRPDADERAGHPARGRAQGEPADAHPALPGLPRPGGRRPDDRQVPVGAGRRQVRDLRRDLREQPRAGATRRRPRRSSAGSRRARRTGSTRPSSRGDAVTLRAGFARRDITQPLGTPSSLGLFTVVTEIWDPLSATAVVLESDGGERVALVGLDLCGLLEASHRSIREAVAARTGLPADRVVLNVSHSHSAPYISADLQELLRPYGLRLHDDDYAAALETAVVEAVEEAADRAVPARVSVGRGLVDRVAGNRRPKLPDGRTVHRYGRPPEELRALPEGLIDPEVVVIRFDRPDGTGDRRDPVVQLPPDRVRARHPDQRLGRFRRPRPDGDRGGVRPDLRLPAGLRRQPGHRQVGVGDALGGHGRDGRAVRPRRGRALRIGRTRSPTATCASPARGSRSSSTRCRPSPTSRPSSTAPPTTPSSPTSSRSATPRPRSPARRAGRRARSPRSPSARTWRSPSCPARSSSSTASRSAPPRPSPTPSSRPTTTTRSSTSRPRPPSPTASTRSTAAGATSARARASAWPTRRSACSGALSPAGRPSPR